MSDIFEKASRRRPVLRFPSTQGDLTTEQLWDLPLKGKGSRTDLDVLAIATARDLKELAEFSFVDAKPDPRKEELELRLDILKRVIEVKKAEALAALEAAKRGERKQKILEALEKVEGSELAAKSKEELLAELNSL